MYTTRIMQKIIKRGVFSDDFWVKEPRHSENVFVGRKVTLYLYIVACVEKRLTTNFLFSKTLLCFFFIRISACWPF